MARRIARAGYEDGFVNRRDNRYGLAALEERFFDQHCGVRVDMTRRMPATGVTRPTGVTAAASRLRE